MDDSHGAARIRDYMTMMMNHLVPASVLALLLASTAVVSAQSLPPDQAQLNAQTQSQLNGQNEQTQLNNLQTQQSIQQNEIRQQQLFNSMPQPGFQQNQSPPVTSTSP